MKRFGDPPRLTLKENFELIRCGCVLGVRDSLYGWACSLYPFLVRLSFVQTKLQTLFAALSTGLHPAGLAILQLILELIPQPMFQLTLLAKLFC